MILNKATSRLQTLKSDRVTHATMLRAVIHQGNSMHLIFYFFLIFSTIWW